MQLTAVRHLDTTQQKYCQTLGVGSFNKQGMTFKFAQIVLVRSKVKAISLLMRCILSPSSVELRLSHLVADASDAADGDLRIS